MLYTVYMMMTTSKHTFATLYNKLDQSYKTDDAYTIAHELDELTACVVRLTGACIEDASEYVIEAEYHSHYATISDSDCVADFALFLKSREE